MSLTVSPTNAAPVCGADSSSGPEDTDQTGAVSCTDADDDSLTTPRSAGRATARPRRLDGNWTYSPTADYHGPDSFTFRANDGSVDSNTATMSITVTRSTTLPCAAMTRAAA